MFSIYQTNFIYPLDIGEQKLICWKCVFVFEFVSTLHIIITKYLVYISLLNNIQLNTNQICNLKVYPWPC